MILYFPAPAAQIMSDTLWALSQTMAAREAKPADTNETLADYVATHRGQRIEIWDVFPPCFRKQAKKCEEMIASGLLTKPLTKKP